jgi:hypothetical protein
MKKLFVQQLDCYAAYIFAAVCLPFHMSAAKVKDKKLKHLLLL